MELFEPDMVWLLVRDPLGLCLWMTALTAVAHREMVDLRASGIDAQIVALLRQRRPRAKA